MSTTSIVIIVVLIGAILAIGLLWYREYQKAQAANGILGLGTKLISAALA